MSGYEETIDDRSELVANGPMVCLGGVRGRDGVLGQFDESDGTAGNPSLLVLLRSHGFRLTVFPCSACWASRRAISCARPMAGGCGYCFDLSRRSVRYLGAVELRQELERRG